MDTVSVPVTSIYGNKYFFDSITTILPYNPQQNGRAEREQGTLIYNVTAMLKDRKLHHKF